MCTTHIHKVVDSGHRYGVQASSSYSMRITSQNGGEQSVLCCSIAVMNIWSSHIARLLVVARGGNMDTGIEWLAVKRGRVGAGGLGGWGGGVAGSGRGSGPSWGWQQEAQWMKAGQVICGWGGGTLLLLRQMPRLLGLISSAKHHPALAKNKLKCLWPVWVSVCACVCVSLEKGHCLIRYQALTEAHTSRVVIVYCSIPTTFFLCSPSRFLSPISISHHQSSWLFLLCLSISIFSPSFPLQQSWLPLQWNK